MILFKNNASSTLANELLVRAVDYSDTLSLPSGHGSLFPAVTSGSGNYFMLTLVAPNADREIVKCTNRSSDTLTILRGQESTTPKAFPIGSIVENRMTAGSLTELLNVTYASSSEVNAGTVDTKAITPAGLNQRTATTSRTGILSLATDIEATAGTNATKGMTPESTAAVITSHNADSGAHSTLISTINTSISNAVPAGSVIAFAGSTAPTGYLEMNGSAVSRTTYAALFAVVGTTYGSGDGSTTFTLPDTRGEFIRGWSHGRAGVDESRTLGSFQDEAFKSHEHTYTGTISRDGNAASGGATWPMMDGDNPESVSGRVFAQAAGGTETRPRNIALMYCIKY